MYIFIGLCVFFQTLLSIFLKVCLYRMILFSGLYSLKTSSFSIFFFLSDIFTKLFYYFQVLTLNVLFIGTWFLSRTGNFVLLVQLVIKFY